MRREYYVKLTDEENAQTAKHEVLKQSFQAALSEASMHVVASYQAAEELSVASAADPHNADE